MQTFLQQLGIQESNPGNSTGKQWFAGNTIITSYSPVDGKEISNVTVADEQIYDTILQKAQQSFQYWRTVPAPRRGEIVRQIGETLRQNKEVLGKLVSYEMGKSLQEGFGEVQEMIDICDFAVGLSRQLYGLSMHSERVHHRMI